MSAVALQDWIESGVPAARAAGTVGRGGGSRNGYPCRAGRAR